MPAWQDLNPEGDGMEGEGIAPDVPVAVEDGEVERRDPILEKALELLGKKLGR